MTDDRKLQQDAKPKHSPGNLVGNYQESGRDTGAPDDGRCARAPGGLVGNHQKGQPDCGPDERHDAPLCGEFAPFEKPTGKTRRDRAAH